MAAARGTCGGRDRGGEAILSSSCRDEQQHLKQAMVSGGSSGNAATATIPAAMSVAEARNRLPQCRARLARQLRLRLRRRPVGLGLDRPQGRDLKGQQRSRVTGKSGCEVRLEARQGARLQSPGMPNRKRRRRSRETPVTGPEERRSSPLLAHDRHRAAAPVSKRR